MSWFLFEPLWAERTHGEERLENHRSFIGSLIARELSLSKSIPHSEPRLCPIYLRAARKIRSEIAAGFRNRLGKAQTLQRFWHTGELCARVCVSAKAHTSSSPSRRQESAVVVHSASRVLIRNPYPLDE
jgi:hypothetical protein